MFVGGSPYGTPGVFVDGMRYYEEPNSELDWDQILALDQIKRIEIYSVATVPPPYKSMGTGGGSGCGSILLGTHEERPTDEKKTP